MPLANDAFFRGVAVEKDLLKIYIVCKKYDLALDQIEYLLTIPGLDNISIPLIRIDPLYDNLRDLARFQKIIKTEYKTVY